MNATHVVINLLTSPGVFWAVWPILEWGVKVGAHAVAVFGLPGINAWKDRVRRRYLRRHADRPAVESEDTTDDPTGEADQLRRRVGNLKAIVTSADWDLLTDLKSVGPDDKQAASLADDVVPD